MLKSRILTGALVVGSMTVASMFAAAPASAATLPSGQQITVIDYIEGDSQFYAASPADATLTAVGAAQGLGDDQIVAVDVDDTGHGFALTNFGGDASGSALYVADANTGTLTGAVQVMLDFLDVQVEADFCTALDYTGGILMAICYEEFEEGDVGYWGILDPTAATGEAWLTPLYQFDDDLETNEFLYFDSMAVDPVSGLVYAVAYPDGAALYTLSEDAGATFVTWMDEPAFGLDFDRSGQAWVTTVTFVDTAEQPAAVSALATLDLADGSNPFLQAMTVDDDLLFVPLVQPITVWGAPALADTGTEAPVQAAAGAAGLLLLGAILAAVTMLRRRRQVEAH